MIVEIPAPSLLAVEPSQTLFAGERYHFRAMFDGGVKVVLEDVVALMIDEEVDTRIMASDVVVNGSVLEFDYQIPATASGKLLSVSMKMENDM